MSLKHLFLTWIFSGSLDSFSQVDTTQLQRALHDMITSGAVTSTSKGNRFISSGTLAGNATYPTPDTFRAIILVTLSPNGIAHARMGYVVICEGKEVVYLDCRKKALKIPQVGWAYEVVDPNERAR